MPYYQINLDFQGAFALIAGTNGLNQSSCEDDIKDNLSILMALQIVEYQEYERQNKINTSSLLLILFFVISIITLTFSLNKNNFGYFFSIGLALSGGILAKFISNYDKNYKGRRECIDIALSIIINSPAPINNYEKINKAIDKINILYNVDP